MILRRLVFLAALSGPLLTAGALAEENAPREKTVAEQIREQQQRALTPEHQKNVQRRIASQQRTRKADVYTVTAPDGAVTLTNVPDNYRHKVGHKREKLTYSPMARLERVAVPKKYSRRTDFTTISKYTSGEFKEIISDAATRYSVDENLIYAVIKCESAFNPAAVSKAGACGLMQLMPGTAADMGITGESIFDPAQNINGGTQYLAKMLELFGDVRLAVAAYNAGPERVREYKGVPPYSETKSYVASVLNKWAQLKNVGPEGREQLLAEANNRIRRGISRPAAPVAAAKQYLIHFHSGLTQPADSVSDKDPYYQIEYNKRIYMVRKDLVARIAEPA